MIRGFFGWILCRVLSPVLCVCVEGLGWQMGCAACEAESRRRPLCSVSAGRFIGVYLKCVLCCVGKNLCPMLRYGSHLHRDPVGLTLSPCIPSLTSWN